MAHSVLFDLAKLPPGALVGVDADGNYRVVKVNNSGALETTASLDGDLTIGAVTIDNTGSNPVPVTLGDEAVVLGDGSAAIGKLTAIPGLDIPAHDYIALSYTGPDLTGVVYKTGGSSGTTVATLTLAYTNSVLTSVTKS